MSPTISPDRAAHRYSMGNGHTPSSVLRPRLSDRLAGRHDRTHDSESPPSITSIPPMPLASPLPALVAFGRDFAGEPSPAAAPLAGDWLAVACQVEQLVRLPAAPSVPPLDDLALALGRALGEAGAPSDATTFDRLSPRVRAVAMAIEDAGALHLAHALVFRWMESSGLSDLEVGRCRALLGRILRQLGATEQALASYGAAEALGRRAALPELTARAYIGYAVLAQLRGNYPEHDRWFAQALDAATAARDATLIAQVRHGMTARAVAIGDFDAAMAHAWQAYLYTRDDRLTGAESLLNLTQLLTDQGYHRAALSGYATVLGGEPPLRIRLPALGGLATAAAHLGLRALYGRAADEIERLDRETEGYSYIRGLALLELWSALRQAGEWQRAEATRLRLLEIATTHRYHELVLRAEAPPSMPTTPAAGVRPPATVRAIVAPESTRIIRDVEELVAPDAILSAF